MRDQIQTDDALPPDDALLHLTSRVRAEFPPPTVLRVPCWSLLAVSIGTFAVSMLPGWGAGTLRALPCVGAPAAYGVLAITKAARWTVATRRVGRAAHSGRAYADADWTGDRCIARRGWMSQSVRAWGLAGFLLVWGCSAFLAGLLSLPVPGAGPPRPWWMDLIALIPALAFVTVAPIAVFRGGVQIQFARFPYVLGEPMRVFVATTAGSPRLRNTEVLLRCVGPGRAPRSVWSTTHVHWSRHVVREWTASPGPDEFVEVDFGDLPIGAPQTALHRFLPVRWELIVTGRTRWGRVMETFVVPVYAAARGPAATA